MLLWAIMLGMAPTPALQKRENCYREETSGGVQVHVYLGDRACVSMAPPREFSGVWINEFEGSRFLGNVASPGARLTDQNRGWLNFDDTLRPARVPVYDHAYRLKFVGRAAANQARPSLDGYGHFGMSNGLVVIDELIAMEDLGPVRVPDAR